MNAVVRRPLELPWYPTDLLRYECCLTCEPSFQAANEFTKHTEYPDSVYFLADDYFLNRPGAQDHMLMIANISKLITYYIAGMRRFINL
jgi:hypothetical protein